MIKNNPQRIGVIGGVGPYAGLLLTKKLFDAKIDARSDQDYPELILYNASSIPDRTEYLLDPIQKKNPEKALQGAVDVLNKAGCTLVGIPCNTAHAPAILNMILARIHGYSMRFVHMIDETMQYVRNYDALIQNIGLLATRGTYASDLYPLCAKKHGLNVVYPKTEDQQILVHSTIYSPDYGIKAFSNPIKEQVTSVLQKEYDRLVADGAEAIILGCTELSLVQDDLKKSVPYFDPLTILANALLSLAR